MGMVESLQQDVEKLYERVTGTRFPRERFRNERISLPSEVDPVPYLRQEIDRLKKLVEQRLIPAGMRRETQWVPAVEVLEEDSEYRIRLELPGVARDDVQVHAGGNTIRVQGERKLAHDPGVRISSSERLYGPFERWFSLPSRVSEGDVEVSLKDGILEISVAKKEAASHSLKPVEVAER